MRLRAAPSSIELHALRGLLYGALHDLLCEVPTDAELSQLRAELANLPEPTPLDRPREELSTALKGAAADRIKLDHRKLHARSTVDFQCEPTFGDARERAARVAHLAGTDDRVLELGILEELADQTAVALRSTDLLRAHQLLELQARFLSDHAGMCLDTLAAQLRGCGVPFYARLGGALAALVERDVLLVHDEQPATAVAGGAP